MKKITEKFPLRIIITLLRIITKSLKGEITIQDTLMFHRIRLHAIRTGIYSTNTKETGSFSYNYSLNTLKALDSMILNKLQLLQFETAFQESKFFVLAATSEGSGSVIDRLSSGIAYSYLYNRVLLFNTSPLVYDFCYEPISIHSLKDVSKECLDGSARFNFLPQKEKFVHSDCKQVVNPPVLSLSLNAVHPLSLPLNTLYIKGLILDSFLKLKQEYKLHIEERKKAIGFKSPIIGVHIRQGDVLFNPLFQSRNIPLQTYLEVLRQVVDKTGIKTVFVTTDSEEVIQQLPKNSGIDFIYDDKEKRYNNFNEAMTREHPELKKQETLTAVKGVYLLAECNYIINTQQSSWSTNSCALSYFRNKKLNRVQVMKGNKADYYVKYTIISNDNLQKE